MKKLRYSISGISSGDYIKNKLDSLGLSYVQQKEVEKIIHNLPISVFGSNIGVKIEDYRIIVYDNKKIIERL
jgi:hypothetical protein